MRRSISLIDPQITHAGENRVWKFIYTPSSQLPKGTRLRFDLLSRGRSIDWEMPSAKKGDPKGIFAYTHPSKVIPAKEVLLKNAVTPCYEFTLPAAIPAGTPLTIQLGADGKKGGVRAQTYLQRRRPFHLFVDTSGKGSFADPEVFMIDIKGNVLDTIQVITRSFVARNKRFDIIVRFEDEWGNLTSYADEDALIELSYENFRDTLNWKLFIPETGFICLPNLYFNEPGVYTIQLTNHKTKSTYRSSPIRCFPDVEENLFWGLLHGESEKVDSTESIDSCLRHFRDEEAFNFFSVSPFENPEETPQETWKTIAETALEFDETDRFTSFLGCQWIGKPKEEGSRVFVFAKEQKNLPRKKEPKYSSLAKIYDTFSPKELISIPTFTMGKGFEYDFKAYNPDFERVVEIYNAWGSSEAPEKEGNPAPIKNSGSKGIKEAKEGSVLQALKNNCRFGFVAGGLDDRGIYEDLFDAGQEQYHPGLTAIIAKEHGRASIFDGLYKRHCYATTGERIILGLFLAGIHMGEEISTEKKPGLFINRHLTGYVAGTKPLEKVEIVRNGEVIKTFSSDTYFLDFAYDDMVPIEKVTIDAKDKKPPFVFYYLRVMQEDGHMAWSSPIWVDVVGQFGSAKAAPVKKTKK